MNDQRDSDQASGVEASLRNVNTQLSLFRTEMDRKSTSAWKVACGVFIGMWAFTISMAVLSFLLSMLFAAALASGLEQATRETRKELEAARLVREEQSKHAPAPAVPGTEPRAPAPAR